MKGSFTFLLSIVLGASALAATPQEEARFIAAVKNAFKKQDAHALVDLHFTEGVGEKQLESMLQFATKIVQMPALEVRLAPFPEEMRLLGERVNAASSYQANIPRTQTLLVLIKSEGGNKQELVFSAGEKDGKLYIPAIIPAE